MFHPLFRRYVFGKTTGGLKLTYPQAFLRLKLQNTHQKIPALDSLFNKPETLLKRESNTGAFL